MSEEALVIIPARNEERCVARTLAAVRGAGAGEVIVVDDASDDRTAGEALRSGAIVVRSSERLGKGGAVEFGLRWIFSHGVEEAKPVVLLDADLGATASQMVRLLEAIRGPEAKMAVAVFPRQGGSRGLGLAVGLARAGIHFYSGRWTAAPLSGQRAIRAGHLRRLMPLWPGFALEVGMTLDALRLGYELIEVPVDMSHRATGWSPSGIIHRGRQLVEIAGCLRNYRRRVRL